jgi:hypothetical protein
MVYLKRFHSHLQLNNYVIRVVEPEMWSAVDASDDRFCVSVVLVFRRDDRRLESSASRLDPENDALQEVERRRLPDAQI